MDVPHNTDLSPDVRCVPGQPRFFHITLHDVVALIVPPRSDTDFQQIRIYIRWANTNTLRAEASRNHQPTTPPTSATGRTTLDLSTDFGVATRRPIGRRRTVRQRQIAVITAYRQKRYTASSPANSARPASNAKLRLFSGSPAVTTSRHTRLTDETRGRSASSSGIIPPPTPASATAEPPQPSSSRQQFREWFEGHANVDS